METKKWYESSGMWGGLIALVSAVLAPVLGVTLDAALQADITSAVVAGGGVVGSLLAIWGRIRATKTIG